MGWRCLNFVVDLSFFIEIIIVFRTAIVDEQRQLITDAKKIAKAYLKGQFCMDMLSTVPLDSIVMLLLGNESMRERSEVKLLAVFKLLRIVKLRRLIRGLNADKKMKSMLKIGELIFFLMLYVHC